MVCAARNEEQLRARALKLAFYLAAVGVVAWVASIFVGEHAFLLIYGPQFIQGVPVMIYATLCAVATFADAGLSTWLIAARRYRGGHRRRAISDAPASDDVFARDGHGRGARAVLGGNVRLFTASSGARMKITLCANRFPPNMVGGAEVMVHVLAVELKRRGHEVSILTLSNRRRARKRMRDGLDVHELPNLNLYDQFRNEERGRLRKMLFGVVDIFNPLMFAKTWRRLGALAPDVLCTNNLKGIGPASWVAAKLRGIPVVHVNHDYWLLCLCSTMFASDHAYATPADNATASRVPRRGCRASSIAR